MMRAPVRNQPCHTMVRTNQMNVPGLAGMNPVKSNSSGGIGFVAWCMRHTGNHACKACMGAETLPLNGLYRDIGTGHAIGVLVRAGRRHFITRHDARYRAYPVMDMPGPRLARSDSMDNPARSP